MAVMLGVDIVDRTADQRRVAAVEHLIAHRIVDPELGQLVVDVLAPDQHRRAVTAVLESDGGTEDVFLLALREQHPFRIGPGRFEGEAQDGRGRIEPGAERLAIGRHVGDRLLGDASVHRRLGDSAGDNFNQPRVERRWDDIVGAEAMADAAIGRCHFFRHRLARQFGQ